MRHLLPVLTAVFACSGCGTVLVGTSRVPTDQAIVDATIDLGAHIIDHGDEWSCVLAAGTCANDQPE